MADIIINRTADRSIRDDERALQLRDPVGASLDFVTEEETQDVGAIKTHLNTLVKKRQNTLPVEHELRDRLDQEIARIKEEYAIHSSKDDKYGYKRIDLRVPLTWRDRGNNPLLAVYRLNKPTMMITSSDRDVDGWGIMAGVTLVVSLILGGLSFLVPEAAMAFGISSGITFGTAVMCALIFFFFNRWASKVHGRLPKIMAKCYADLCAHAKNSRYRDITWTSEFTAGAIPDDVRVEIDTATKKFGKRNVFIVSEGAWHRNNREYTPKLDPLVIGHAKGVTYLVTKFDLTPLEEAVAEEFTT